MNEIIIPKYEIQEYIDSQERYRWGEKLRKAILQRFHEEEMKMFKKFLEENNVQNS